MTHQIIHRLCTLITRCFNSICVAIFPKPLHSICFSSGECSPCNVVRKRIACHGGTFRTPSPKKQHAVCFLTVFHMPLTIFAMRPFMRKEVSALKRCARTYLKNPLQSLTLAVKRTTCGQSFKPSTSYVSSPKSSWVHHFIPPLFPSREI